VARDAERPLSAEGATLVRAAGEALRAGGVVPDILLASPLRRAQQTAELLSRALRWSGPIETCDALKPEASEEQFVELLRRRPADSCVVAVGHQPLLGSLTAMLLGRSGDVVGVKPSTIIWLDFAQWPRVEQGILRGLWGPELWEKLKL